MPTVATINFTGTLQKGQITTSPWAAWGIQFPDYGFVPSRPLLTLETLELPSVDGARYRVGGAHWPVFRMEAIIPALNYQTAAQMACDMEMTQGETITLLMPLAFQTAIALQVIKCIARPNAARIIGATASAAPGTVPGGGSVLAESAASVDVSWVVQCFKATSTA